MVDYDREQLAALLSPDGKGQPSCLDREVRAWLLPPDAIVQERCLRAASGELEDVLAAPRPAQAWAELMRVPAEERPWAPEPDANRHGFPERLPERIRIALGLPSRPPPRGLSLRQLEDHLFADPWRRLWPEHEMEQKRIHWGTRNNGWRTRNNQGDMLISFGYFLMQRGAHRDPQAVVGWFLELWREALLFDDIRERHPETKGTCCGKPDCRNSRSGKSSMRWPFVHLLVLWNQAQMGSAWLNQVFQMVLDMGLMHLAGFGSVPAPDSNSEELCMLRKAAVSHMTMAELSPVVNERLGGPQYLDVILTTVRNPALPHDDGTFGFGVPQSPEEAAQDDRLSLVDMVTLDAVRARFTELRHDPQSNPAVQTEYLQLALRLQIYLVRLVRRLPPHSSLSRMRAGLTHRLPGLMDTKHSEETNTLATPNARQNLLVSLTQLHHSLMQDAPAVDPLRLDTWTRLMPMVLDGAIGNHHRAAAVAFNLGFADTLFAAEAVALAGTPRGLPQFMQAVFMSKLFKATLAAADEGDPIPKFCVKLIMEHSFLWRLPEILEAIDDFDEESVASWYPRENPRQRLCEDIFTWLNWMLSAEARNPVGLAAAQVVLRVNARGLRAWLAQNQRLRPIVPGVVQLLESSDPAIDWDALPPEYHIYGLPPGRTRFRSLAAARIRAREQAFERLAHRETTVWALAGFNSGFQEIREAVESGLPPDLRRRRLDEYPKHLSSYVCARHREADAAPQANRGGPPASGRRKQALSAQQQMRARLRAKAKALSQAKAGDAKRPHNEGAAARHGAGSAAEQPGMPESGDEQDQASRQLCDAAEGDGRNQSKNRKKNLKRRLNRKRQKDLSHPQDQP